jgi:hypothetical protein
MCGCRRVVGVTSGLGNFTVATDRGKHPTRHVIASIGFSINRTRWRCLGRICPGEALLQGASAYVRQRVAVIGARNSGGKGRARLLIGTARR